MSPLKGTHFSFPILALPLLTPCNTIYSNSCKSLWFKIMLCSLVLKIRVSKLIFLWAVRSLAHSPCLLICAFLNVRGADAVQHLCHKCKRCNSEKETPRLVTPSTDKLLLWAVPQYKLQNAIQPLEYEVLSFSLTNISQQLSEKNIINCVYGAITHVLFQDGSNLSWRHLETLYSSFLSCYVPILRSLQHLFLFLSNTIKKKNKVSQKFRDCKEP